MKVTLEKPRAQVCKFLAHYAGPQSAFTKQAEAATGFSGYRVATLSSILDSFSEYLRALSVGARLRATRQAMPADADALRQGDYQERNRPKRQTAHSRSMGGLPQQEGERESGASWSVLSGNRLE
ncbi:MAG TPA: hypothetical protein DDY14_14730 [Chromatiaceae bacterium]|jgi:hypothetical protein|nr:MAG: hypothetical protein N838_19665 [Thiohalocapsa sp. PB-PSB1]QQO53685.1 MAG: hypothetical protein N838_10295 [Thiohalocapsa sp. PB-PSB1]HBG96537.1 hypothetical protein [Chromatiaceae bacterium]HCS91527.1 hypothetical protein [Chromatiaceae bacterium]